MKPSEAILLGSIGTEQSFGYLIDNNGRTCAMGGAYVAEGIELMKDAEILGLEAPYNSGFVWSYKTPTFIPLSWRWVFRDINYKCPECDQKGGFSSCAGVVIHLNDQHRWTRPRIAEWVAQQEAIVEAEQVKALPALTSCR